MDDPFADDSAPTRIRPTVPDWPLWTLVGLSVAAVIVALLNRPLYSLIAYVLLVVASFALLFWYRMATVAVTRIADADASVVGIKPKEKLAILAIVAGCVANGIVLGLEVGGWEMWFS